MPSTWAKKYLLISFLLLITAGSFLGCAAESPQQTQLGSDHSFSAPLPKALNAVEITQSTLIVEIIIDPEKTPPAAGCKTFRSTPPPSLFPGRSPEP